MGRRNAMKRFLNEACLSSAASGDLTLESWDAIAHTEAEENCRIYGVKLGKKTGVTYEIKDGRNWSQLKCNMRKIEPALFKDDPPLREWAAAKLLEHEFKRCAIESKVSAAKQSTPGQAVDQSRCQEQDVAKEKQQHDDRCNAVWGGDYHALTDGLATASREHNALTSTVESVVSQVDGGRKRCQKLEQELVNEKATRASKLIALDEALQLSSDAVRALSEQNRKLKEEARRLKAAVKEAKKNESGK